MKTSYLNKRKIFNDPVYGFISIPSAIIFDIIEHPYFQRLRRIKQLGLTHLVYPGALHTRFHHALGAMHLMNQALSVLQSKGHNVTPEEEQGALIAILLHDIGHGPFSHALENTLIENVSHEYLSELFMQHLNKEFNGQLSLAIEIFNATYKKRFLHKLVSSQLDVDRLDFLKRDSFFTGVSEGVLGTDRIIKMLNVHNDELAVEAKGIYSIEKFIVSRRLMYWQVYYHKTVISAEFLLINILKRAKCLIGQNMQLFSTPALNMFLKNSFNKKDFDNDKSLLEKFSMLDDFDILTSIKVWSEHQDNILSRLCKSMINRKLYGVKIRNTPFENTYVNELKSLVANEYKISENEAGYFVFSDIIENYAYNPKRDKINILYNDGTVVDIAEASDQLNVDVLSKTVTKYFLCYPKEFFFTKK